MLIDLTLRGLTLEDSAQISAKIDPALLSLTLRYLTLLYLTLLDLAQISLTSLRLALLKLAQVNLALIDPALIDSKEVDLDLAHSALILPALVCPVSGRLNMKKPSLFKTSLDRVRLRFSILYLTVQPEESLQANGSRTTSRHAANPSTSRHSPSVFAPWRARAI